MAKSNAKQSIPVTVTAKELAAFLRVSPRTISNWTREGTLKQTRDGNYDFYESVFAWAQHDFGSHRQAIEKAKAEKLQRENKLAAGKLMSVAEHCESIDKLCAALKQWFRSIPGRVVALGLPTDLAVLHENIRIQCAQAMQEMVEAAKNNFDRVPDDDTSLDLEPADSSNQIN
jgi:DNA-binding transcriptional MerR regulator